MKEFPPASLLFRMIAGSEFLDPSAFILLENGMPQV
jgi:hypothetical protein